MNEMPPAIAGFFDMQNQRDARAVAACFTPHGQVKDEGKLYSGQDQIAGWSAQTAERYRMTLQPLRTVFAEACWQVQSRVTGDFPGSPIELWFKFILENGAIASLEVTQ